MPRAYDSGHAQRDQDVALSQLASVIVTWLAPVEVAVTVLVDEL